MKKIKTRQKYRDIVPESLNYKNIFKYNDDRIKNSEIFIFEEGNQISGVAIILEDGYYNLCSTNKYRDTFIKNINDIIVSYPQTRIIEAGIGTGHIVKSLRETGKDFVIVELNIESFNYFKEKFPDINLVNDNIFDYIVNNDIQNSFITLRLNTSFFTNIEEFFTFINKLSNLHNKHNAIIMESRYYNFFEELKNHPNMIYLDSTTWSGYVSFIFSLDNL